MNIKILDSWLREYLQTDATPKQISKALSLTSVSIERLEKWKQDWTYDIEVTTNRPDLASINGLAREAGAALPQQGIEAIYKPLQINRHSGELKATPESIADSGQARMTIINETSLVNRICAVVMEVTTQQSPKEIKDRLESSDIRSINNIVDITNYVMRVTGQPTHVMDYDRLGNYLKIREAKKGEAITTLDKKNYTLSGGDIVAENKNGEIVDLLGIMGLEKTVVTDKTKRIVFFINNVNSTKVRKTSMEHGIRTEAVQLNEKHLDPNLCATVLQYGIQLYEKFAHGQVISQIIDMYPNKLEEKQVKVNLQKINSVIGVDIPEKQSVEILTKLGFQVATDENSLIVTIPTFRSHDINLPEDIIEEIARIYGYHNLPSELPLLNTQQPKPMTNTFYWEQRAKHALKYWGFTEVYTYSMVSENLYEGPLDTAVTIANPLNEDLVYMRRSLIPSLLHVISENKQREHIQIFEIANVYDKKNNSLPDEIRLLAGIVKQPNVSFYKVKGYIEQLFKDLGITHYEFRLSESGGDGAEIYIKNHEQIGNIEILDENMIDFELNFDLMTAYATLKKTYREPYKFPPIFEDIALHIPEKILTGDVIDEIKRHHAFIKDVSLLDRYGDSRTFHIVYQDESKNLTTEEVKEIHKKILQSLRKKWGIQEKS